VQPGQVDHRRPGVVDGAAGDLVAGAGVGQVLQHQDEPGLAVGDGRVQAVGSAHRQPVAQLDVEGDLLAVGHAGHVAGDVGPAELGDHRALAAVGLLEPGPHRGGHLAGADRLGGDPAHGGAGAGGAEHGVEPRGRELVGPVDDGGVGRLGRPSVGGVGCFGHASPS
jgi:hypothetical protein